MIDDRKHGVDATRHIPTGSADIRYAMRFTRDEALIAQYKTLRKALYGIDPRFVGFRLFDQAGAEDYEDPDDQMLIVHAGQQVYGGACLRVSTPHHPVLLNTEQDILPPPGHGSFSLREHFPALALDTYAYAEFVRIVIDPRLRKGRAVRQLYHAALQRCLDHRVRYMFGIADRVRTRLYRQIYRNVGMDSGVLGVGIPMRPAYEGLPMDLIYVDMKHLYATPHDPDATCLREPCEDFAFY